MMATDLQAAPLDLEGALLVDPETAARLLGLSRQTLARWRCTGLGPRFVRLGRTIRYEPAELARFIAARTHAHTAAPALANDEASA